MIRILRKTQEGNKKGHQEGGQAIDLHRNTSTWSARPLHRLRGFFACDSLNVSSYYERRASHELSARTGRPFALHSLSSNLRDRHFEPSKPICGPRQTLC